jgi:hypothetical protein
MSYRYSLPSVQKLKDFIPIGFKSTTFKRNPRVRREAREFANIRLEERRQRDQAPIPTLNLPKVDMSNLDLYQIYLLRLRDATPHGTPFDALREADDLYNNPTFQNIKPTWFYMDFITRRDLEPLIFTIFISILLGCDKTHDFTSERVRNELGKTYWFTTLKNNTKELLKHLREATIDQVFDVCEAAVTASNIANLNSDVLLGHCLCIINLELRLGSCTAYMFNGTERDYSSSILARFFFNDETAKNVAFAISRILGISLVEHQDILSDATSSNIVNVLTPIPLLFGEWDTVVVKIDATSATVNHVEDFVEIRNALTRGQQLLVLDSASANDPAKTGTLGKIFTDFERCYYQYYNQDINVFVRIGNTNVNILTATLRPPNEIVGVVDPTQQALMVPDIKLSVSRFLGKDMSTHDIAPKTNSLGSVITKIANKWNSYGGTHILSAANEANFRDMVTKYTMEKTLGDFLQIISYAATPKPKVFVTVDRITGVFAGILGSTVILDGGTRNRRTAFRRLFVTSMYADTKEISIVQDVCLPLVGLRFGKTGNNISKRLKSMSHLELKNKLKSVGIKITKNVRGKRRYLSRKELENKALLFNKLQNTAKKMKIKIMYKSRNGLYKYKTYIRLQKEINSKYNTHRKYKKPVVRNFNFG